MNKVNFSLVSNLVFLLNPFLWFSFGVVEILYNRRFSYLKFSILMGVIGFSIFPWGDGYERFRVFLSAEYFSLYEFILRGFAQGDIFFYAISYLIYNLGGSYQLVQFAFVFIGTYILTLSLRNILIDINSKNRFFVFVLVMFLINWIALANNLRFMLATIIMIHAVFTKERIGNENKFNVLFFFAIMTHFYALLVYLVYRLIVFFDLKFNRVGYIYFLFFCLLFAFISPFLLKQSVSLFNLIFGSDSVIVRKMMSYLLGEDGVITKMISSPAQMVNHFFKQLPLLLLVSYFIIWGDTRVKSVRIFIVFFGFCLLFVYFYSIFIRLSYFCLLYGVWAYLYQWKSRVNSDIRFITLFLSAFLFFSINIVYFQRIINRDGINLINKNSLCIFVRPVFLSGQCSFVEEEIHNGNSQFRILKMESINRTMDTLESHG